MTKSEKRLIDQIKNDVRTLLHTHLDRGQRRLLTDAKEMLNLLKVEENGNDSTPESLQQRGVN